MDELEEFNDPEKGVTIRIIDNIAPHYMNLGICLLNDDKGNILGQIVDDHHRAERKILEILQKWINGMGKIKSNTWDGLIKCLKKRKLMVLVEEIESVLCDEDTEKEATRKEVEKKDMPTQNDHRDSLEGKNDITQEVASKGDQTQDKHKDSLTSQRETRQNDMTQKSPSKKDQTHDNRELHKDKSNQRMDKTQDNNKVPAKQKLKDSDDLSNIKAKDRDSLQMLENFGIFCIIIAILGLIVVGVFVLRKQNQTLEQGLLFGFGLVFSLLLGFGMYLVLGLEGAKDVISILEDLKRLYLNKDK